MSSGQDQARGQGMAGRGLADGPDETQERVVGVDLEHDGRLVTDDAEGVRDAVRQGHVVARASTAKACSPHRMARRPETR